MPRLRHSLLILLLLSIPLFFIKINDKHDWGDDYAQYLKEAQNIAGGKPFYLSTAVYNDLNRDYAPPQYPPGFPLILAPVVKVYGIALLPLMCFNSILVAAFMFALFFYFRKYATDLSAICLSIIVVYSLQMVQMKQNILSDIPGALWVTIYLTLRNSEFFSWRRTLLLILLALMATLTRSQLMLLLVAEALLLPIQAIVIYRRQKSFSFKTIYNSISLKVLAGVTLLYLLLTNTVFATPHSTLHYYNGFLRHDDRDLWALIGSNINDLLALFTSTFHLKTNDPFWQAPVTVMEYMATILMITGFILSIRKKIRVDDLFFLLVCALMLVLSVDQGYRFLFPLLPVTFYYCFVGARMYLPQLFQFRPKVLALAATLFYFILAFDMLHSSLGAATLSNTPYDPLDLQAFAWLRKNINDTDLIIFTKPRALALYTNKRTMVLAPAMNIEENLKKMRQVNAKYILVRKGLDDEYYNGFLKNIDPAPDSVRIDSAYMLYDLRRGY